MIHYTLKANKRACMTEIFYCPNVKTCQQYGPVNPLTPGQVDVTFVHSSRCQHLLEDGKEAIKKFGNRAGEFRRCTICRTCWTAQSDGKMIETVGCESIVQELGVVSQASSSRPPSLSKTQASSSNRSEPTLEAMFQFAQSPVKTDLEMEYDWEEDY